MCVCFVFFVAYAFAFACFVSCLRVPHQNSEDRLDEDLRQLLKRLPKSTKRNLIQDLSGDPGGSTRVLSGQARGLAERRASEPHFVAISENTPLAPPEDKVGVVMVVVMWVGGGGGGVGWLCWSYSLLRHTYVFPPAPPLPTFLLLPRVSLPRVQEVTAKDYADSLIEVEDLPELKEVKALHKALKKADQDWVASFRDNGGMAGIYKVRTCNRR